MAEITLVKGETTALDRTWMSMPDGSTRQVAVHVVHDLPHLIVESLFGIEDGLWAVLARGGFAAANLARTRSHGRRARLVTDVALDELGARNWRGHVVAKAAGMAATAGRARLLTCVSCGHGASLRHLNPRVEVHINPHSQPRADARRGDPEARSRHEHQPARSWARSAASRRGAYPAGIRA